MTCTTWLTPHSRSRARGEREREINFAHLTAACMAAAPGSRFGRPLHIQAPGLANGRTKRLVAMGIGLHERRQVSIGSAHQVVELPAYRGAYDAATSDSDDEATAEPTRLSNKEMEEEVAGSVAARLTRIAYVRRPPADAWCFASADPEDDQCMMPLLASGLLIGGGRSNYVPSLNGPLSVRRGSAKGMLACEMESAGGGGGGAAGGGANGCRFDSAGGGEGCTFSSSSSHAKSGTRLLSVQLRLDGVTRRREAMPMWEPPPKR